MEKERKRDSLLVNCASNGEQELQRRRAKEERKREKRKAQKGEGERERDRERKREREREKGKREYTRESIVPYRSYYCTYVVRCFC